MAETETARASEIEAEVAELRRDLDRADDWHAAARIRATITSKRAALAALRRNGTALR
jgi:hypothetical protein